MLRAAFDASSCYPHWIYAVAGYVAPADDWDATLAEWRDAIDYWKMPRFHLSELHDLLGGHMAELCEKNFCNIIGRSRLHAIGAAVFTEDWAQPDWRGDTTPRFATPYQQTLWSTLETLAKHCEEKFAGQSVAVMVDIDAPEASINEVFAKAQEKHPNLDALAVSTSFKHLELQYADLAAGSLRRSWRDITLREDCELPWGVIPMGLGEKHRTSVWSLRGGAIVGRAIRKHEELNRLHRKRKEIEGDLERLMTNPDGLSPQMLAEQIEALRLLLALLD